MEIVIRRASPADAPALSTLAAKIYTDTFAETNNPEDLSAFLAQTYNEAQQRSEIENPGIITLLAECDGQLGAYAQLKFGTPPPCVDGPDPMEIGRFYVDKAFHGRGVAQRLMKEIEDLARSRGTRTMWLGVWEHNVRAQAFYKKYGFERVGEQPFIVGTDLQTDWVVQRRLD
jgi:diamine N-acetyltransferase